MQELTMILLSNSFSPFYSLFKNYQNLKQTFFWIKLMAKNTQQHLRKLFPKKIKSNQH